MFRFNLPIVALIVPALFVLAQDDSSRSALVTVRFDVTLADEAATDNDLFLSGNHKALGSWQPNGLRLKKLATGTYTAEISVPTGTTLQFKVTQGSWENVEKNGDLSDRPNREYKVKADENASDDGKSPPKVKIVVDRWASQQGGESHVVGQLEFHDAIPDAPDERTRKIAVWLPPGYDENQDRYPVLYLQDGQNLFDRKTAAFGVEWQVDETAKQLIDQRKIRPVIIVGIWNTPNRIDEYTPTRNQWHGHSGDADGYLRYVVETLKPFIDRHYRTKPERDSTGIGGSSLGGLVAIYACQRYPGVFSRCAALSPSLHWDDENLLRSFEANANNASGMEDVRFWIDMGTHEGGSEEARQSNIERTRRLAKAFGKSQANAEKNIRHVEVPDGRHNEASWASRFGDVLEFLFPPE